MTTHLDDSRTAARIRLVDEHVRAENAHDLDDLMRTFGAAPTFDVNRDHIDGHDGVHAFYAELIRGFPDLRIDVKHRHVAADAVVLEVVVTGTHQHTWNGVPPRGGRIELPVCAVFPFDAEERLAGERVYFDMALMLRQMGASPGTASGA
jgi:steroid delta-isomerase-like uncharacterized protein